MPKFCSYCKTAPADHTIRNCRAPEWPPWNDQWCDRCAKSSHEASQCTEPQGILSCDKCGHGGRHNTDFCDLNPQVQSELDQFTKLKRDEVVRKRDEAAKKRASAASGSTASSSSSRTAGPSSRNTGQSKTLPLRGPPPSKSSAKPSSSASKGSGSVQQPPTELKELRMKKADNFEPPKPEQEDQEKAEWAKSNYKLATSQCSTARKDGDIRANFFRVNINVNIQNNPDIRLYRIVLGQIQGRTVTNRHAKRALIDQILNQYGPHAQIWVTDYSHYIVSVGPLYNDPTLPNTVGMVFEAPHNRLSGTGTVIDQITSFIVYERRLNFPELRRWVDPAVLFDQRNTYLPDEDLKMLNILSWKHIYDRAHPRGQFKTVGNKFYSVVTANNNPKFLGNFVYLVRNGFYSSMRPGNGSLLLNVNATTTAFYPSVTVAVWLDRRLGAFNSMPTPKLQAELTGLKVTFNGDPQRKIRVITGFSALDVDRQMFIPNNGASTTVRNYMRSQYSAPQRAGLDFLSGACCVNTGSRVANQEIWYPADHLEIVEWQSVKVLIDDPNMSSQMIGFAKRNPSENQAMILQDVRYPLGIEQVGQTQHMYQSFGLDISPEFITTESRYLRPPVLWFTKPGQPRNNNKGEMPIVRNNASWNLKPISENANHSFLTAITQTEGAPLDIHIIRVTQHGRGGNVGIFPTKIRNALNTYGIFINQGQLPMVADAAKNFNPVSQTRRMNFKATLDAAYTQLGSPRLVVVLLPNTDTTTYSDVKCMKINFKLGGVNLGPRLDELETILGGRAMIVGADVTHAGKGDRSCPSLAGVVATCDQQVVHYLASARLQPNNTEYIADLEGMMLERLATYRRWSDHGRDSFPERIVFYRDGVSESQYGMIRDRELPQIQRACRQAMQENETMPRITLVIVGKRHHSRFYGWNPRDTANLNAGLVVDRDVIAPKQFNFYLQSHGSPLGTARSAHYVVLENGIGYNANQLQQLTNFLCFYGSRATKGLSVCTPARYADILCDRLRMYMRPVIEHQLQAPMNAGLPWYRQRPQLWEVPNPQDPPNDQRTNSWHPDLDDIMFYL
ncbi:Protein argonaute 1A [Lachnellula arida]|uniref:Protein argonaute 1A n=1 Tax=Lachnellula arida TaxID=1316785 RepID=A0A8T9B6Q2_9HELO|nr:Protein argonaute 1A [Lachnellula arida]